MSDIYADDNNLRSNIQVQEGLDFILNHLQEPLFPRKVMTKDIGYQLEAFNKEEALWYYKSSNDILDVTKIEGKSLELNKEEFNLDDVIINAINDITLGRDFRKNGTIKLSYNPQDILVKAAKERISQVISNILNNAMEFTVEGTILVSV